MESKDLEFIINTVTDIFYSIGSIYVTSDDIFSPNEVFGGTWDMIKSVELSEDDLYSQEVFLWRRIS